MNGFNVNVEITDTICDKCCKNTVTKTVLVTSPSQQIDLQNNYVLNVIDITSTYFTVLIQNGINTIVRNVFTNYAMQICLPDKCFQHVLTISGTIIPLTT